MPKGIKGPQIRYCDICYACSENKEVRYSQKYGMYLCSKHRHHLDRHGHILGKTRNDGNDYIIYDDYAEIILRNKNRKEVGRTTIDLDDVEKCKRYTWRLNIGAKQKESLPNVSCTTKGKIHKSLSLSRYLMNYNGPLQVDHIDRNRLNNRKINLRIVDGFQNMANNKHSGVSKDKYNNYRANIRRHNIHYYLGKYKTEDEALKVVQKARRLYDENIEEFNAYMNELNVTPRPHYKEKIGA